MMLRYPNDSLGKCYEPLHEIQGDGDHSREWMYQLAEQQQRTSVSKDVQVMFMTYTENVTKGVRNPEEGMSLPLVEAASPQSRRLQELIRRYPDGLSVPYMP